MHRRPWRSSQRQGPGGPTAQSPDSLFLSRVCVSTGVRLEPQLWRASPHETDKAPPELKASGRTKTCSGFKTSVPPKLWSLAPSHQLSERWPSLWVQTMSVLASTGAQEARARLPHLPDAQVSLGEEACHLSHRYRLDISPQAEGPEREAAPPPGSCTPTCA